MIKVLIVEDVPSIQKYMMFILSYDPEIQIIGTAGSGEEAIQILKQMKPDVITMDINMPGMGGIKATRCIMETMPLPIVIVSGSLDPKEVNISFQAIEAGALSILERPPGIGHPEHEIKVRELIQTIKLMSEVKVVRRWNNSPVKNINENTDSPLSDIPDISLQENDIKIVGIGASTGGPVAIKKILNDLPHDFSVPILLVQHISSGFVNGFVEWLNISSNLPVCIALQNEQTKPGHVYVAPDNIQMGINKEGFVYLSNYEPVKQQKPSVSYLFHSIVENYGNNALCILLSGMGNDGADELLMLKNVGGITIAQNEESSVVYGMPGEAVKIGAAQYVLPPDIIARVLKKIIMR
jgi:two-component system, chemotaxis family, protein-glutamate methylesterase/glutaminase